jgi:RNA polymerase sigma-70 factor, ECF subfamily
MENLSALVEQAQRGDKVAEVALFEWLRLYVSGLVRARYGQRLAECDADASDLTQATLLRVTQSLVDYRGDCDGQFKTWVTTIVRHLVADRARRKPPERTTSGDSSSGSVGDIAADQSTPSERLMRLEQSARLQQALEELPTDQRNAVRWRYIDGCSFDEVALRLGGRTVDAATQLVRRGIRRLNELLVSTSSDKGFISHRHGHVAPLPPGAG